MLLRLTNRIINNEIMYICDVSKKSSKIYFCLLLNFFLLFYLKNLNKINSNYSFLLNGFFHFHSKCIYSKKYFKEKYIIFIYFLINKYIHINSFSKYIYSLDMILLNKLYPSKNIHDKKNLDNLVYFDIFSENATNYKNIYQSIKKNIGYDFRFTLRILNNQIFRLYNGVIDTDDQILSYIRKFIKGFFLFDFFVNLNFFLLFGSKISNTIFIKKCIGKKANGVRFVYDINILKTIMKSILNLVIKLIMVFIENAIYVNKVLPIWIKISSYIKIGILDIFFKSSTIEIISSLLYFNNRKLTQFLSMKLNNKMPMYIMKSFNILIKKKNEILTSTKKSSNNMKIFINYVKFQLFILHRYTNNIEISIKIQFFFLMKFFFSNTQFLKEKNYDYLVFNDGYIKYRKKILSDLKYFVKLILLNSFLKLNIKKHNDSHSNVLLVINKKSNSFYYLGCNKLIIPIRKFFNYQNNMPNIILNLKDTRKNFWSNWSIIRKNEKLEIFLNNTIYTDGTVFNNIIKDNNYHTYNKTIIILKIKRKNFWFFIKSKLLPKKNNFTFFRNKYKSIMLLSKFSTFIRNLQKLWYLFTKENKLFINSFYNFKSEHANQTNLFNLVISKYHNINRSNIFPFLFNNTVFNKYLIKNSNYKVKHRYVLIKKISIYKKNNESVPFFLFKFDDSFDNLVSFKKAQTYYFPKISNLLCLEGVGFFKYSCGFGMLKLNLLLISFYKNTGSTNKMIYLMPYHIIKVLKNIIYEKKYHIPNLIGIIKNHRSFIFEISNLFIEIRKFYETYLFKIVSISRKKIYQYRTLMKIQDYIIKNILIRYLKKKIKYNIEKKHSSDYFKEISYYTALNNSSLTNNKNFTDILNFMYKNFEAISCLLYLKDNWELKCFFLKNFFHSLCFSSKNFFYVVSWINKLELCNFNLIVLEFDSYLYDDFLYLHIAHVLLNNYDYNKKILVFYRALNFNKLVLIMLLKKIQFKKLGNLSYIYEIKKKKNMSVILENLQCLRKSSWFIKTYDLKISKFFKIFFIQSSLSLHVKKTLLFEYIINIELIISFLLFLLINGISKTDISVCMHDKFKYILKIFKNNKKSQLFKKKYMLNKKFQGKYKKIIIVDKKVCFSTVHVGSFKLLFQIVTHTKEILISLKTNLYSHKKKSCTEKKSLSLKFFNTLYLYEKLFYKNNTIISNDKFFFPYLVNYFLLIYLVRVKLFIYLIIK